MFASNLFLYKRATKDAATGVELVHGLIKSGKDLVHGD